MVGGALQGVCSVLEPLSSASNIHVLIVRKPMVVCDLDKSGIRSRDVSCMALNSTQAEPSGMAVCDTRSLTSYTVKRNFESPVIPSLARKLTVLRKPGLLLLWKTNIKTCKELHNQYL